jgi:hypothetical protein
MGAQVAQAHQGAPVEQDQIVVVANVHVHAPQHARLGTHDVPLHRRDPGFPRFTKDLGNGPSRIVMHFKGTQQRPCWKIEVTRSGVYDVHVGVFPLALTVGIRVPDRSGLTSVHVSKPADSGQGSLAVQQCQRVNLRRSLPTYDVEIIIS